MIRRTFLLFAALAALAPAPCSAGVEGDGEAVMLVAAPQMPDPRFARTVLVVTFPQDAGPMGLVLNKPAGMTLGELFGPDRPELADHPDPILLGGPVDPEGMLFLFHWPEHPVKALPVGGDVYLSGDGKLFEALVADRSASAGRRFFAGYSGWAEGQLDREIASGDWLVLPVDLDALFDPDTERLYERLLPRAQGRSVRLPAAGRSHLSRAPASALPSPAKPR